MMRSTFAGLALATTLSSAAVAQFEPITSPQDAACREEARGNLFSTPNPQGLSLYNLGASIYRACMARTAPTGRRTRQRQAR